MPSPPVLPPLSLPFDTGEDIIFALNISVSSTMWPRWRFRRTQLFSRQFVELSKSGLGDVFLLLIGKAPKPRRESGQVLPQLLAVSTRCHQLRRSSPSTEQLSRHLRQGRARLPGRQSLQCLPPRLGQAWMVGGAAEQLVGQGDRLMVEDRTRSRQTEAGAVVARRELPRWP